MVNELVRFDYYVNAADNDFENRFTNGTGLNQLQVNGITGGCLETPQTISWGNDNAVYCTRFRGVIGDSSDLSVSFRYDTTQLNSINFDRAASLWMKPYVDPNHYIIASVLDTRRIQIVSYSAAASSAVMQLQHGHWYNLVLSSLFDGGGLNDEITINAQVNDLGISGNDPPIPTGFTNTILHDSIMIADTAIEASLTGTHWGGALYLDDFHFIGTKSYDNCISTAVKENNDENEFTFSRSNNILTVYTGAEYSTSEVTIINISGQKLVEEKINPGKPEVDLSDLADGYYLVNLSNEKSSVTKKFILIR